MRHEAASIIVNSRFNPPQKTNPAHGAATLSPPARTRASRPQAREPKAARSVPSQHNSISFRCVLKQIQPFHNFADVVHRQIRLRPAEEDDRMQAGGPVADVARLGFRRQILISQLQRDIKIDLFAPKVCRSLERERVPSLVRTGSSMWASGCTCTHGLAAWGPGERKGGKQPDGVGLAAV